MAGEHGTYGWINGQQFVYNDDTLSWEPAAPAGSMSVDNLEIYLDGVEGLLGDLLTELQAKTEPGNTQAISGPVQVQDGSGNTIHSGTVSTASLTGTNRGLQTQSVLYLRNTDSSVGAWQGESGYATFASGNYPWAKVMRSSHAVTETTLDGLDEFMSVDLRERSLESVAVYIRSSSLVGTVKFLTSPGDSAFATEVYNTNTRTWMTGQLTNPTTDTLYLVPCAGLQSIQVKVTAYTSGSLLISAHGGPGVLASYANVSGSVVKEIRSSSSSVTSVNDSASSVQLLAANTSRLGATIFNDSSEALYVKLGTTASTTDFTVKVAADGYYEVPFNYTGRVDGIWSADSTGAARITEFT
jgi:hypothetical protein